MNPEANPLLEEALRRQYPNVDPESLAGAAAERLEGLVRGVKGKYFEVLVRDRLNAEGHVGEIQLREGLESLLADSSTQPVWDLEIVDNSDGSTVEVLQLKATEAMLKKRNADLLELANNMGHHLSEMKGASSAPDDLAPRLERFRELEEAYALILRAAPQWPFSRTTLSYLGAINFLGLASTILAIALTFQRVFRI